MVIVTKIVSVATEAVIIVFHVNGELVITVKTVIYSAVSGPSYYVDKHAMEHISHCG